jgi:hypothetical protein
VNANTTATDITATFLRADGTTLVKHVTVNPISRATIGISGFPECDVPELSNEFVGAILDSTLRVVVEHSLDFDVDGVGIRA